MTIFVETEHEVVQFLDEFASQDSLVIPIFADIKTHPAVNPLSLLYVSFLSGHTYILPFRHNETIPLEVNVISRCVTPHQVYTPDKKALAHVMPDISMVDIKGLEYFFYGQVTDSTELYSIHHKKFYNQYGRFINLNCSLPIMTILEFLDRYAKVLWYTIRNSTDIINSSAFRFHNDIVVPACQFMERGGIHVDVEKFVIKYGEHAKRYVHNNLLYTEYNPYTLAGRVSNKHGGISFTSLNKHDGTRAMFTSRFDAGKLIMIDFESFHLRLMAELLNIQLPSTSLHEYFGQQYFGVDTLTPAQYDESKQITFALLYGEEQYTDIPFFKSVQTYIRNIWEVASHIGYTESPTGRRIYLNRIDKPSPSKLFNYLLQLREMEVGMTGIHQLMPIFSGKNSKIILYTYDAILIDFDTTDGDDMLHQIVDVLEQNGKYPVRIYSGSNYHDLHNITDAIKA